MFFEVMTMKENYRDLSELLKASSAAEGYFAQLPRGVQEKAMAHKGLIHSTKSLRNMVKIWSLEDQP